MLYINNINNIWYLINKIMIERVTIERVNIMCKKKIITKY